MRCIKRIVLLFFLVLFARPLGLYSSEKDPRSAIADIINSILEEKNEEKKQEYIKKLRSYSPDDVSSRWLATLDSAWRVAVKVQIIDVLSEYNDKRFVIPMANYLIDPHFVIRKAAAQTLKKIGDDRLYPVILKIANSSNPVHRIYFIEAMNYLYDRRFYAFLTNMLRDENKSVRIYVLNCLKVNRIGESLGLVRNAALHDKNDEVRIAAIEALGAFRDIGAIPLLHIILNDKNRDVRRESAKSLSMIGSAASANFLSLRLLAEDDNEIKELLIEALVLIKRVGDVRGVEKILLTDGSTGFRIKSAYILGFSGTYAAQAALLQALNDPDYRVRAEVCNSLGNYRNRQALASLLEVLGREEGVYVKSAALYAVKRMNDKYSLPGLFDLYAREHDPVFKELLQEAVREYIKRYL